MSRTATAAVAVAPYRTELQSFPVTGHGPDDGWLEIEVAGVCGTDWEIYGRASRAKHLGPIILGHENVGRIAAVGEDAARRWGVTAGDRVAVEEFLPCGSCDLCRSGRYWLCPATDSRSGGPYLRYGATPTDVPPSLWGGFGHFQYLHPHSLVHPISTDVAGDLAALFVPISNGIRWITSVGRVPVGGSVLVIGPGQHGLGCVVAAAQAGAETVVVAGAGGDERRLDVAQQLGATLTVGEGEDGASAVAGATGGRGVDVVVDLAPGATQTVATAIDAAAVGGVVILAGSKHGRPVPEFLNDVVVRKELTVRGVRGHDYRSVRSALRLIESGRLPLELMCTNRFGLSEVDLALRTVGERSDPEAIHVNVVPD